MVQRAPNFYAKAWDARQRRIESEGSPNFRHTFGEILTTANEYVPIEETFPAARKYAPLDSLVITNNSTQDVDLELNGRNFMLIPAGVIQAIDRRAVLTFRLTNNDGGTVVDGTIRANVWRSPLDADRAAARRG